MSAAAGYTYARSGVEKGGGPHPIPTTVTSGADAPPTAFGDPQ